MKPLQLMEMRDGFILFSITFTNTFTCVYMCVCYTHVNVQVCVPVHAYVEARAGCWVSSAVLFALVP